MKNAKKCRENRSAKIVRFENINKAGAVLARLTTQGLNNNLGCKLKTENAFFKI